MGFAKLLSTSPLIPFNSIYIKLLKNVKKLKFENLNYVKGQPGPQLYFEHHNDIRVLCNSPHQSFPPFLQNDKESGKDTSRRDLQGTGRQSQGTRT